MSEYEDSVASHLSRILHSDSYNVVISSAAYVHTNTGTDTQTNGQADRFADAQTDAWTHIKLNGVLR